jgi:hypothetical protein
MSVDRPGLIRTLEQTYQALQRLVGGIPNDALDFRPSADSWTVREILAHFVDDEMYVMRLRLERIVKEDDPQLTPHDEQRWHATRNTSRDQLTELLSDFNLQRLASLGMIAMLRDSDWVRSGFQPEYGRFTGEEWLARWVEHDTVHLRQIESNLAAYSQSPGQSSNL